MTRKVRQIRRKGKDVGIVTVPKTAAPDLEARVALIQALIPVALDRVHEELQADVARLAGERYARDGRRPGHVRWTAQRGSIYLADQKLPIQVPRVRDRVRNVEVPLPIYESCNSPGPVTWASCTESSGASRRGSMSGARKRCPKRLG